MAVEERELTDITAESLATLRLEEVLQPKYSPGEFRLSETSQCPRKRVARVLGYEAEGFDKEDAEYFERGHVVEAWVVERLREAFPRRVRTQVPIVLPELHASGHPDIWVPVQKKIYEVKSISERALFFGLPKKEHVFQLLACLHFLRDSTGNRRADSGELVYVMAGTRWIVKSYPVLYQPDVCARMEPELQSLWEYVERHELPPVPEGYDADQYPCTWHTKTGEHECPFHKHCHESAATAVVPASEDLGKLIAEYAPVVDAYRTAKQAADNLEAQKKHLEGLPSASMGDLTEAAGAGHVLRRTPVAGRVSCDIDAAVRCGVVTEAALEPFRSQGQGYVRWTLRKEGAKSA